MRHKNESRQNLLTPAQRVRVAFHDDVPRTWAEERREPEGYGRGVTAADVEAYSISSETDGPDPWRNYYHRIENGIYAAEIGWIFDGKKDERGVEYDDRTEAEALNDAIADRWLRDRLAKTLTDLSRR